VTKTIRQEPDVDFYYFDRATLDNVELAEHFAHHGALVVFEPSLVGDNVEIFRRAVRAADIVKYADDRLDDIEDLGISEVPIEIQTMGSRGLKVRSSNATGGAWIKVDAFELPSGVVDAAGSGDWCTVGIIRALAGVTRSAVRQLSLERLISATVYGQALAALNCLTVGAQGLLKHFPAEKFRDPLEGLACGYPKAGAHYLVGSACLSDLAWDAEEVLSVLSRRLPLGGDLFPCCSP